MSQNVKPALIPIGGQRIFGTYHEAIGTLPSNPALLILHGYQSCKNDRFRFSYELGQELAHLGIATLRIDFRGCGDSDGKLEEMTIPSLVEDALTSLEWLSHSHNSLSIMGRSLGAGIALKAAARFTVQSAILISPLFDGGQWRGVREVAHLVDFSVEEELKSLQGLPLLEFHAGEDEVLSREHVEMYRNYASSHHVIRVVEGADHTYSRADLRQLVRREVVHWMLGRVV